MKHYFFSTFIGVS